MNDNIISIKSRKPLEEEKRQAEQSAAELQEMSNKARSEWIANIQKLVDEGRLTDIVVLGLDRDKGLFLADVFFDAKALTPMERFAFAGAMETLKLELTEGALMVPVLNSEGDVVDPEEAIEEFDV